MSVGLILFWLFGVIMNLLSIKVLVVKVGIRWDPLIVVLSLIMPFVILIIFLFFILIYFYLERKTKD